MPRTPNIVIVMAEQWSPFADPLQCALPVDMPALALLARSSTCFTHAHCNAPVCGPSRASFLTGLYVHHHQTWDNGSIIPPHVPTFAHLLNQAGYQTAMCGRMHLHGMDQQRGFGLRLSSEIINPLPVCDADMPGALTSVPPAIAQMPRPAQGYAPTFSDSPIYQHDRYVTERAVDFLQNRRGERDGRPFALVVGYFAAHSGFKPCPELAPLYEKYRQRALPVPAFTPDHFAQLPEHFQRLHGYGKPSSRMFDPEHHRHELAWYLARVEYFDQQLGRVLAALDASGQRDDTLLLVTADHGESMGHRGYWGKMNFTERAQRVPLYVRTPGQTHSRQIDNHPAMLVDVLPTLADYAGIGVAGPCDGASLRPVLEDPARAEPGRLVCSEYHGYLSPAGMYMTLRDGWKYCHYQCETDELYDLHRDPEETHNRIADPAAQARLHSLRADLASALDVRATERAVTTYNAQRRASHLGLISNVDLMNELAHQHRRWRDALAEPWWDGGKYIGQWEPAPVNPIR